MPVWMKCKECENINEILIDSDNLNYCPDCQSVDCFEDIEKEMDKYNKFVGVVNIGPAQFYKYREK
jgi:hypothetical protein